MKTTEQLNAEFTSATPEGKRILIAEDVISQLAAKRFLATEGCWLTIDADRSSPSTQVCDIETSEKNCSCCLLGAMMLSEVRINNHLAVKDLSWSHFGRYAMHFDVADGFGEGPTHGHRLAEYFDAGQLRLIEMAYEQGHGFYDWDEYDETEAAAVNFGVLHDDTDDRMRAIMGNVIANNGVFIP